MGGISGVVISHLMFYDDIPLIITISEIERSGGAYIAEGIGTFVLVLTILLLDRNKSEKTSLVVGLLVGGMLLSTSSTMFANPQVTIARIFTYSAAGIRPFDAIIFIITQIIGTLFAVVTFQSISKEKKSINNI
jgi:glycerol uptake facilitator-like aquaporin